MLDGLKELYDREGIDWWSEQQIVYSRVARGLCWACGAINCRCVGRYLYEDEHGVKRLLRVEGAIPVGIISAMRANTSSYWVEVEGFDRTVSEVDNVVVEDCELYVRLGDDMREVDNLLLAKYLSSSLPRSTNESACEDD